MNYFYITGTSSGIGHAIAELLLKDAQNVVFGISRRNTITAQSYHHHFMDLFDVTAAQHFEFDDLNDAKRIVLINNAATLGEVKHVGALSSGAIIRGYNLNLVGPAILTNNFIKAYRDAAAEKIIINISSGAAHHPLDGWSIYGSTKAGLDVLSQVVAKEQELDKLDYPFTVFSVSPGIVDTAMQDGIRALDRTDFNNVDLFIHYKEQGVLVKPKDVATKFLDLIERSNEYKEVLVSFSGNVLPRKDSV